MKSAFVVPAQVSENCLAASSTAFRSVIPSDLSSARASWVSKVEPAIFIIPFVIPTPAAVIPPPARAAIPKPDFRPDRREPRFWDALPMGAVSWSTMFSTTLRL